MENEDEKSTNLFGDVSLWLDSRPLGDISVEWREKKHNEKETSRIMLKFVAWFLLVFIKVSTI